MSDKRKRVESAYMVPAVAKAFQILDILKESEREMAISEIAKVSGWHKSTVHKLLFTLEQIGVVERDEASKLFSLGIALADYGRVSLKRFDFRKFAKPFLAQLEKATGETSVLAVLSKSKMVMIDKKEPDNPVRVSPDIGTPFAATLTANGKVLLAWLPAGEIDEIIAAEGYPKRTPNSITDPKIFREELALTRKRGFATDLEEFNVGTRAVAAPVSNSSGQVVAALAVAGPASRMSEERVEYCARKCIEIADELSKNLKARQLT